MYIVRIDDMFCLSSAEGGARATRGSHAKMAAGDAANQRARAAFQTCHNMHLNYTPCRGSLKTKRVYPIGGYDALNIKIAKTRFSLSIRMHGVIIESYPAIRNFNSFFIMDNIFESFKS